MSVMQETAAKLPGGARSAAPSGHAAARQGMEPAVAKGRGLRVRRSRRPLAERASALTAGTCCNALCASPGLSCA